MSHALSSIGKRTENKTTISQRPGQLDLSIGQYIINRMQDYGIQDCFGIPGDYVLNFYSMLEKSPINMVGCTREDCAGFAADAYARIRGMGALCVTYCVGGLSVCNSVAGAFAEKSPVVLITGSPGMNERINNPLLHHKVRNAKYSRNSASRQRNWSIRSWRLAKSTAFWTLAIDSSVRCISNYPATWSMSSHR